MDLTNLSSNWKKLQATLPLTKPPPTVNTANHTTTQSHIRPKPQDAVNNHTRKRKRRDIAVSTSSSSGHSLPPRKKPKQYTMSSTTNQTSSTSTIPPNTFTSISLRNVGLNPSTTIGTYIALDCEMVGLAPDGVESILARISIVNYDGDCIYDSYVLPLPGQRISDFRTPISGIRPQDMRHARSFREVQAQVKEILHERIVVGHALRHDWAVLGFGHPRDSVRDTCKHQPYRKLVGGGTPGLKLLTSLVLGVPVQEGEHCSLEDARAAMALFRRDKDKFGAETEMRRKRSTTNGRRGKWK